MPATVRESFEFSFQADTSQLDRAAVAVDKLTGTFVDAQGKLRDARGRFVDTGASIDKMASSTDQLTGSQKKLRDEADKANKKLDEQSDKAKKTSANFGQLGLNAGRAIQDVVQGGIGGGLNNIESLVTSLGYGPGVAGALTAVGVAAFVAKPFLKNIADQLGFVSDAADPLMTDMERLEGKIKDIGKLEIKTAVDRLELQAAEQDLKRLKDAAEAYNKVRNMKTEHERESEKQVDALLAEGEGQGRRGRDAEELIRKQIAKDTLPTDAGVSAVQEKIKAKQREIDDLANGSEMDKLNDVKFGITEGLKKDIQNLEIELAGKREQVFQDAKTKAGRLVAPADVSKGETVEGKQAELSAALRKVGFDKLATSIEGASPAQVKTKSEQAEAKRTADALNSELKGQAKAMQDLYNFLVLKGQAPEGEALQDLMDEFGFNPANAPAMDTKLKEGYVVSLNKRRKMAAITGRNDTIEEDWLGEMEAQGEAGMVRQLKGTPLARFNAAEAKKAEKAQAKQDREDDRAEAKVDEAFANLDEFEAKQQTKTINQAAGKFGGSFEPFIMQLLAQHQLAGSPMNDDQLKTTISNLVAEQLRQNKAKDADGKLLSYEQLMGAGQAITGHALQSYGQKQVELANMGIQGIQQLQAIAGQQNANLDRLMQRFMRVETNNNRLMNEIKRTGRTAQNRGRQRRMEIPEPSMLI